MVARYIYISSGCDLVTLCFCSEAYCCKQLVTCGLRLGCVLLRLVTVGLRSGCILVTFWLHVGYGWSRLGYALGMSWLRFGYVKVYFLECLGRILFTFGYVLVTFGYVILVTFWLRFGYVLVTFCYGWLRCGCGLATFCLRVGYDVTFWLHFGYDWLLSVTVGYVLVTGLFTFWLRHFGYVLVTVWLRFGYGWVTLMVTFWLRFG